MSPARRARKRQWDRDRRIRQGIRGHCSDCNAKTDSARCDGCLEKRRNSTRARWDFARRTRDFVARAAAAGNVEAAALMAEAPATRQERTW